MMKLVLISIAASLLFNPPLVGIEDDKAGDAGLDFTPPTTYGPLDKDGDGVSDSYGQTQHFEGGGVLVVIDSDALIDDFDIKLPQDLALYEAMLGWALIHEYIHVFTPGPNPSSVYADPPGAGYL
jgi:hypothetical protein